MGDICPYSERGVFFLGHLSHSGIPLLTLVHIHPLLTFMNGCLQIIKVGVTFRGVLDQGLDSKLKHETEISIYGTQVTVRLVVLLVYFDFSGSTGFTSTKLDTNSSVFTLIQCIPSTYR